MIISKLPCSFNIISQFYGLGEWANVKYSLHFNPWENSQLLTTYTESLCMSWGLPQAPNHHQVYVG